MTIGSMASLDPPDLSRWGLHCFCLGARETPHRAVAADNNGRILYLARHGVTRAGLRTVGVNTLDSQIAWLKALDLLSFDGEIFRTTFPTLGAETMRQLRNRSRRRADLTTDALVPAARDVGDLLALHDARAHHYAVLFGHGLDGILWQELRAVGELPSTELSVSKPFWNGVFWAINPERMGAAGTNEAIRGAETLVTVWTKDTAARLGAVERLWERGEWRESVPVVSTRPADSLHAACGEVARVALAALEELVNELAEAGFAGLTRQQLFVVVGHELIWDLAENLCRAGHLPVPPRTLDDRATGGSLKAWAYIRVTSD
jgi:hypothetical protein